MIDAGDVVLADLGLELRHQVVVLSTKAAIRATGRALVAPLVDGPDDEVPSPWRVGGFAIDMMTTVSTDRLLTQTGRVESQALRRMQVAARHLL